MMNKITNSSYVIPISFKIAALRLGKGTAHLATDSDN